MTDPFAVTATSLGDDCKRDDSSSVPSGRNLCICGGAASATITVPFRGSTAMGYRVLKLTRTRSLAPPMTEYLQSGG